MKRSICPIIVLFFITNIAYAADLKSTANDLKLTAKNNVSSKIAEITDNFVKSTSEYMSSFDRIKYFDLSVDLREHLKPSIVIKSVNKISEDSDSAFFNQTNFTSHDGDATFNFGLGKRKLLYNDLVMLGSNIFFDYQFDENHFRNGFGLEAISSVFDLRGNYYNALSSTKTTDEGTEKALDGHDLQMDYHVPGKHNTAVYLNTFRWKNSSSDFKEEGQKYGITSQIGYLHFEGGYLNDNKNNDSYFGSVKLVIPLGNTTTKTLEKVQRKTFEYVSVRDKLYIPVKRENKIKVVKISKSGVKVSGF